MRRLLLALGVALCLSVLIEAQNPISIAQIGTTAVTTTLPVSGTITANQGGAPWSVSQSGTWTVQPGNTANTTPWLTTIQQGGNPATVTVANALKVDGSAVTQPVSGTITANQGGTWTVQPGNTANTTPWLLTISQGGNSATVSAAGALKIDGSAVTQPISAASLPLPTGASTSAKQPALGTAGAASADVITIQGIAAMTKLLVTPDSVALPANQSVNVSQINGVTPLMGNGITGTGSQRVTIASDNTAFAVNNTQQGTASHNVAQIAGTATDVNSGLKSAGTIRVVLATDQPQLTNKLLVTPDALPANQSVNVAQMNGVTVLMNNGVAGTGSHRVTQSNDATSLATFGVGATGAAPPVNANLTGGLASGATGGFLTSVTTCDLSKPINISTGTTTLMVTGVAGRQVRICSFHMITAAADNVAWVEGTGATCGVGIAGMAGGTTAATGYNFAANGGIAIGSGIGEVLTTTTTGDSVCLATSAATQLSGFIKYTIY